MTLLLIGCQPKPEPYQWPIPQGFPQPLVPDDNPMSIAKIELGRHLFYDLDLSFNQTQSCASCHHQEFAFAERLKTSVGSTGEVLRRNSQALVNMAYNADFTWAHNNLKTLEMQILIPVFSEEPIELGATGHETQILARLDKAPYSDLLEQAFPGQAMSFDIIVKSLASFVRSLISFDSDFDRYAYHMQDDALDESQLRGMNLFFSEKLECFHCHGGLNFSQASKHVEQTLDVSPFHNTGLYNLDGKGAFPDSDQGLIELTQNPLDMGRFRAPSLRNIALTAPYMHDGSVASLEELIAIYAAGGRGDGINNPLKSPFVQGFDISEEEQGDLINFLHSLTDKNFVKNPSYSNPWTK